MRGIISPCRARDAQGLATAGPLSVSTPLKVTAGRGDRSEAEPVAARPGAHINIKHHLPNHAFNQFKIKKGNNCKSGPNFTK